MEMTKSEKLLKKKEKQKIRRFFSICCHPRKGVVQGFPNSYFQQFFCKIFQTIRKSDSKNFKSI